MDVELPINIQRQPDDTTCGPTCLHAIYQYYQASVTLEDVIASTHKLNEGGTLAVFLACDALKRGFQATIYTYNLQFFDPSWFTTSEVNISERLLLQAQAKRNPDLQVATDGYLEFLHLGGQLRYVDLTTRLLRSIIRRRLPILTGLSSTYLYRAKRESAHMDKGDDISGYPEGHFVVLSGYHKSDRTMLINDPFEPNPVSGSSSYSINIDRVICAIMLGVLTHDANLLIIKPSKNTKHI